MVRDHRSRTPFACRSPRGSVLLPTAARLRRKTPTIGRPVAIDTTAIDVAVTQPSQRNQRFARRPIAVVDAASGMTIAWSIAPAIVPTRRRTRLADAVFRRYRRRRENRDA
jgi:hypothetical protein